MKAGPIALGVTRAERLQRIAEEAGEPADFLGYWSIYAHMSARDRAGNETGLATAARHQACTRRDQSIRRAA